MNGLRSLFLRTAAGIVLPSDRQFRRKIGTGGVIVGLVLAAYAYGPDAAREAEATSSGIPLVGEPSARVPLPATILAQATPARPDAAPTVESLVPVPEPANVPPLTRADIEGDGAPKTTQSIEAGVPVPQPANVPPITRETIEPKSKTVATPPAPAATAPSAPSQDAAAPAPAPELDAATIKTLTGKDLIKAPLAATLAPADAGVAGKLRDLLAGRADRFVERRDDRQDVEAFYRDRGFKPLWIEEGRQAERAAAVARYLAGVGADGLYPADYPVPNFNVADADALAQAELRLTASVVTFARHARTGRIHYTRVSGDIAYDLDQPDAAELLSRLANPGDAAATLASYLPQHEGYKALKAKLAEARGQASPEKEIVRVPEGPTLKPGMEDVRVAALRRRLEVPGNPNDPRFDDAVLEAVKRFQESSGLQPDGLVGPATLARLNHVVRSNRVDAIIANLERWRWLPRDLGRTHVMVNIPDFTLRVIRDGKLVWSTRIVVGKPTLQTPLISTEMKYITVNPTWNVPPSIIANEYIPAMRQDPYAMERIGLRVEENRDGTLRIYQPPGDNNALGRLRFNFPNKFLVYQHDTPDKNLFSHDRRAYSHGCMRVQDPVKYAEVLLSLVLPREGYTQERIRRMFGPSEQNINFPVHIPVHLTYQTAYVDDAGKLVLREDIYDHDERTLAILKGGERRVADIAIERKQTVVSRDELRLPGGGYYGFGSPYSSRGAGNNPFEDFFRRVFR